MNTKKLKNRGFSIYIAVVASLILMGVSVAIIHSINRSLDQASNIARSNQAFFMAEAGKEAAFFHHSVRGAGLKLDDQNNNQKINFPELGANVRWKIDGREESDHYIEGEMHENEKITIPLYWDSSDNVGGNVNIYSMLNTERTSLKLSFPDDYTFKGTNPSKDEVAIVWSVSRKNGNKYETWIPQADDAGDPCGNGTFYCKSDKELGANGSTTLTPSHWAAGVIDFNSQKKGKILPSGTTTSLQDFMSNAFSSNYEISFQPVLPFIDENDKNFAVLKFKLEGNGNVEIPRNIYTITSTVDFKGFKKVVAENQKEKPSIGAFDYAIFK